jgi:LmbE family N-acetylglucosaminyl deacetylase
MKNSNGKRLCSRRVRFALALCALSAALLAPARGLCQQSAPTPALESDEIELYQALLDLQNPWTVMCIAAHPDDEDGATLTVLRRQFGAHTVTLFSTYGEGGQNAVGPELYEELGAIRARETEEASRIQGSEPAFLALPDFGFSKSAEEAFRIWNHTEALRRMVLKIRQLRPDVIITNHGTTVGHGHHQATGRLAVEAFDAAADPQRFPEQMVEGLRPWQAQRLFVRISSFDVGASDKKLEEEAAAKGRIISVNPNERDPVRNSTYAEQALSALQRHASQGPWPQRVPEGGARLIRYRLALEAKQAQPLPPNAQTFLDGLRPPAEIANWLEQLKLDNRPLTSFIKQRERIFYVLAGFRLNRQPRPIYHHASSNSQLINERMDRALAAVSGIKLTVAPRPALVVPNSSVTLDITISNRGEMMAIVTGASAPVGKIGPRPLQLPPKTSIALKQQHLIPDNAPVNIPHSAHLYDGLLAGKQFQVSYEVEINHVRFPVTAWAGVDIAPVVEIKSITPSPLVLTPETIKRHQTFLVRLINHRNSAIEGKLTAGGPDPDSARIRDGLVSGFGPGEISRAFKLAPGETKDVRLERVGLFEVMEFTQNRKHALPNLMSLKVTEENSAKELTKQRVHVVYTDARVPEGLRVGYIRSFDETLRNALSALGVESKELGIEDVRRGDLSSYDAIIIDNRGYLAHPELVQLNARLLDYAQAGGNLIVFYHRTNEWNPDPQKARPQLAPYPITVGNSRVTDETAPIEFTEGGHALLNFPNKITQDDFSGWIQERGLYFPREWDAKYNAILSTSDAGEAPLRGGLLAADYGRGRYIYTSLVWYRQLRAGVPGAYRMLANMISYGRARKG